MAAPAGNLYSFLKGLGYSRSGTGNRGRRLRAKEADGLRPDFFQRGGWTGLSRRAKAAMAAGAAVGMLSPVVVAAAGRHRPKPNRHGTPVRTAVAVAKARLGTATTQLTISGVVAPTTAVSLAFNAAGRVSVVQVTPGEQVQPGQVLAALGQSLAGAQLAQSRAAVAVAQAKLQAALAGAGPATVSVDQAEVNRAKVLLYGAQQQYQSAVASFQDRATAAQALVAAQNQVNQAKAAMAVAQGNVAAAQNKLQQVEAGQAASPANTLPATITADQTTLKADQAQLATDEQTLSNAQKSYQRDQAQLQLDQATYGTLAGQYPQDEAEYQQLLQAYQNGTGYPNNPYAAKLAAAQTIASQAQNAYNLIAQAQQAVQADQVAVLAAQKAVQADNAAIQNAQANLTAAQNQLSALQSTSPLTLQAAQIALQQAQAAQEASATEYRDAQLSLKAAQAVYNDRTAAQAAVDQAATAVKSAQANLAVAEAQLKAAQAPPSAATLAVLEAGVRQAEAALRVVEAQLARDVLRAPFPGIVTAVMVQPGSVVSGASPVVTLQTASLTVQGTVSQTQASQLQIGDRATVTVPGGAQPLPATVIAVSPAANPQSLGFTVTLGLLSNPSWLRAGTFASAAIVTHTARRVVLVPSSAIVTINGYPQVFVVGKDDRIGLKSVRPVLSNGQASEVQGLAAGTTVVTSGKTYLAPNDRVRITETVSVPTSITANATAGFVTSLPMNAASTAASGPAKSAAVPAKGG